MRTVNIQFPDPDHDRPLDPLWWAPLALACEQAAADRRHRYLDPDDFMVMGRIVRPPRPTIFLYKHRYTRAYLNLDATATAYRYHPPRDIERRSGSYRAHRSLDEALLALGQWELPWLKPGLEAERRGLKWEERWRLRWRLEAGELAEDPWEDDLRPCRCQGQRADGWDDDGAEPGEGGVAQPAGGRGHLRVVGGDR